jgi:PAS domain S-box-containing protein
VDRLIGVDAEKAILWWPRLVEQSQLPRGNTHPVVELAFRGQPHLFRISQSSVACAEKVVGRLIMLQNITAAKMAEEALRVSESRFRSLTENAPVIIFAVDQQGRVTYTNPACTKVLGYRREEVLGKSFRQFLAEEVENLPSDAFDRLIDGREAILESNLYLQHKDGTRRLFSACASANSDGEGRVTGIIGMAKDITEEVKLQQQFFQAQKMEAIGTLAGGIAHDFNNLLMGMQANISLMRLDANLPPALQEKLIRIEDQIQSGASLTRQLLGYARKGKYVVTNINLRRLLQETLDLVQRTNKNITTRSNLTIDPTFMEADRGQMELVLLNLFVNAVDAMPRGGELGVTSTVVNIAEPSKQWPEAKPGAYVEVKINDTGVGMDPAVMERIFEPFFTTKEIGQGTGLGLASVYGVVQNHGGFIRVDSQPNVGTTFTLLLPASNRSTESSTPGPAVIQLPQRRGRVLLVDDETLILDYCGEMIETLGFTVLKANGGKEALQIFDAEHERIQLVVLDMVMPHMDGHQLFEELKKINPDVRVLLSSGFALDARAEKILSDGRHGWLKKPYNRDQLAQAMAAMLAPRQSRQPIDFDTVAN